MTFFKRYLSAYNLKLSNEIHVQTQEVFYLLHFTFMVWHIGSGVVLRCFLYVALLWYFSIVKVCNSSLCSS